MNNINFINPVPPQRKKDVRLWVWFTLIVGTAALAIIATTTGIQWYTWYTIKTEKRALHEQLAPFAKEMEIQRKQTADKTLLHQHLNKLTKYSKNPKNPAALLGSLRTLFGTAPLQSISFSKNNFETQILCTNAQQATAYLQKLLANDSIKTVRLTSLQAQQKQLIATFKGKAK